MSPTWRGGSAVSAASATDGGGQRPAFVFPPRTYNWQWRLVQRIRRKDPLFRDALLECDREIRRRLGWSVDEFLGRNPRTIGRDFSEEHFEPMLTAVQIAQVECWRRRGVEAGAVVASSGGEVAAAYAAGALSAEETMHVACAWSRAIREGDVPRGGMVFVQTRLEEATGLRATMQRTVHIIGDSAPKARAFAGDEAAIEEFVSLLNARGLAYRRPRVPFAYHLPLLDRDKANFLRRFSGPAGRRPAIPVYSSASGGLLRDARFDAQHWYDVFCGPAFVTAASRAMLQDGYDRFLSISPTSGVTFPIRHIAAALGKEVLVSSSLSCLAENGAPFLQRRHPSMALIRSVLKRTLWAARRSGW